MKNNVISTNYDESKIHFIKGLVENTIPQNIPKKICLVILDTDYYSSTIHELNHLYPLVKKGGVIIIDDYGTWSGVKKAVDEYLISLPKASYSKRRYDPRDKKALIIKKLAI